MRTAAQKRADKKEREKERKKEAAKAREKKAAVTNQPLATVTTEESIGKPQADISEDRKAESSKDPINGMTIVK